MAWIERSRGAFYTADPEACEPAPVPGPYVFQDIGPARFRNDKVFLTKGRKDRYLRRDEGPHRCVGYLHRGDRTASYLWLTGPADRPLEVPWDPVRLVVPPGVAYIWDCRTVRAHRNRGLYQAGLCQTAAIAAEEGARAVLIYTHDWNEPSRRAILSAGFHRTFRTTMLRAGSLCLVHRQGRWPTLARSKEPVQLLSASEGPDDTAPDAPRERNPRGSGDPRGPDPHRASTQHEEGDL